LIVEEWRFFIFEIAPTVLLLICKEPQAKQQAGSNPLEWVGRRRLIAPFGLTPAGNLTTLRLADGSPFS
jgi:hypothetical protein